MNERRWTAADFDYALPQELIAQSPPAERGDSRLLVVPRGYVRHAEHRDGSPGEARFRDLHFGDLPSLIPAGDLLVVNSTRVLHARLRGLRLGGGHAEVLLIHPSTDDMWIAMGTPGSAMKPGKQIALSDGITIETIAVLDDGTRQVRFRGATAAEAIARFGRVPLPPYIAREPTPDDAERYQTVYAERAGSVAAPTAGLHFTTALLDDLRSRGVGIGALDLEVGPGTFRPVGDGDIAEHVMHAERFEIGVDLARAITACRARGGHVWAVGTTVVRALESAAGEGGTVTPGAGETRLMIAPGHAFRRGRPADHQLSPAAIDAADARGRVCRIRHHQGGLCARRRGALPVL